MDINSEQQETLFLGLKPRRVSWGCGLCFCNFLSETNIFGLGIVLQTRLFSELQELELFLLEHELKRVFQRFWPTSVTSSPEQTTLVWVPFFYQAQFPSSKNHPYWDMNPEELF
jgi:hypothetical protein